MSLGAGEKTKDNSTFRQYSPGEGVGTDINANVQLEASLSLGLFPEIGFGVSMFKGRLIDAKVALAGRNQISATASVSANTCGIQGPCLKLDSDFSLSWIASGRLGPWGVGFSDEIFSAYKELWKGVRCLFYTKFISVPGMRIIVPLSTVCWRS